jgi:hypothetical protein
MIQNYNKGDGKSDKGKEELKRNIWRSRPLVVSKEFSK